MALTWDATKTKWATLPGEEKDLLRSELEWMIYATLTLEWGMVTEENAAEWLERAVTLYVAYGEDPEWLKRIIATFPNFIGLETNGGYTKPTTAAFNRKVAKAAGSTAKGIIRNT